MTDDAKSPGRTTEAERRRARQAEQLRDNLKRRKAQIKERRAGAGDEPQALEKED